jgi:uncharacterized membrane protein YdjX (TVP38/TMEM64 family)
MAGIYRNSFPAWGNYMRNQKILFLYGAAVASLSLAYFISPISGGTLLQRLTGFEALAQANPVATALVFLAVSAALAYLAFPAMPLIYMAAGYCMDSFAGGAIVLLGSAFGALGAFILYREHMPRRPQTLANPRSQVKIWLTLLGLRLSPIVPAPLVNFFAAFYHVSPVQLMTTTLLGSAPLILFYSQLGRQGHELLSGAPPHFQQFSGYLVVLAISTLLSAMGPWKSFLNEIKHLKDEAAASLGLSSGASA